MIIVAKKYICATLLFPHKLNPSLTKSVTKNVNTLKKNTLVVQGTESIIKQILVIKKNQKKQKGKASCCSRRKKHVRRFYSRAKNGLVFTI